MDTASVATALHSEQPVVPPEGGKTVEVGGFFASTGGGIGELNALI